MMRTSHRGGDGGRGGIWQGEAGMWGEMWGHCKAPRAAVGTWDTAEGCGGTQRGMVETGGGHSSTAELCSLQSLSPSARRAAAAAAPAAPAPAARRRMRRMRRKAAGSQRTKRRRRKRGRRGRRREAPRRPPPRGVRAGTPRRLRPPRLSWCPGLPYSLLSLQPQRGGGGD